MSVQRSFLSKWSIVIVLAYFLLALFTLVSIALSKQLEQLFKETFFFMEFNLVWFGIIIVIYGFYSLYRNYNRMKRLGTKEPLDTQFLIVMAFLFLTLSATLSFLTSSGSPFSFTEVQSFAIDATSKVMLYGAFVAGLFSIIIPKIVRRS